MAIGKSKKVKFTDKKLVIDFKERSIYFEWFDKFTYIKYIKKPRIIKPQREVIGVSGKTCFIMLIFIMILTAFSIGFISGLIISDIRASNVVRGWSECSQGTEYTNYKIVY